MTEFKVPNLGENIETGDVTRVLVNVGDTIELEQPVVELETDKATIEVPSSVAGTVKEIKVKPGDKVKVGAVVLTVDGDTETAAQATEAAAQEATTAEKSSEEHAEPEPEQPVPVEETTAQEQRPADRKVVAMRRAPRAVAEPAKPARGESEISPPEPAESARTVSGPGAPRQAEPSRVAAPASPSVRRLAREVGVDINEVRGSGSDGRISQEDVKEHARRILSSIGASRAPGERAPVAPLPDFQEWGAVERQPMSNIRRKTAEHLAHAWTAIPHVTQFDKADITAMEALRSKYRKQVEQAGGNLTVTAMLVKVLAVAVREFPQFNSSIDPDRQEIIYKKYVNIGVAVDTDRGLLVPVIRNADQKNITQIAVELHQSAQKARDRKLTLDDMSGGSMSISNLGGIGGNYFTPIVNWPEVAILGVSRGIMEPVWVPSHTSDGASGPDAAAGGFEPRQLLPLSLSYDHRVIDGADAMRFLRWVVEAIEQPFLLSLLS